MIDDKQYVVDGAKIGYIVNARLPVRYTVTEGDEFQGQDITESIVPIEITDLINIALEFTHGSLALEVDEYDERYLKPAFEQLATEVDTRGLRRMAIATSEFVGVPNVPPGSSGTLPGSATDPYAEAVEKLDMGSVPMEHRIAMLAPKMHRYLTQGVQSLFNPVASISANYRKGQFAHDQLGFDEWYKTQTVYRHTIGALGGTPLVNGADQSGSSLVTDGWTAAAATRLKEGDKIRIANVYAVNPLTRVSTGNLKSFTVTVDAASTAGGAATLTISPAIVGPGSPYQNVNALPANDAAITIFGHASTYANTQTLLNLGYVKDAYTMVSADLPQVEGAWMCKRVRSKQLGLAFRVWKQGDIRLNTQPCRTDFLFGWKAVREELGIVIVG